MEFDLIQVLGKDIGSAEVSEAIQRYNLTELQDDPPFRRYYMCRKKGLELLAENDLVVDIQIFLQPTKQFVAFDDPLPFEIQKGMSQSQVHQLLGPPSMSNEFRSRYEMPEIGAILNVRYDDSLTLKYLSIGLPL
jgi:hypothetical protein